MALIFPWFKCLRGLAHRAGLEKLVRRNVALLSLLGLPILAAPGASTGSLHDAESGIILGDWPGNAAHREAVLFGFDRKAFPFQAGVRTHLLAGQNPMNVLPPGPEGSHDEFIRFYGTVLKIDGVFHLWYWGEYGPERTQIGRGHGGREDGESTDSPRRPFLCLARSHDGVTWEKPSLGLVEFAGSRANNITDFIVPESLVPAAAILHDPQDPDPSRRFKLAYEARYNGQARFCVAFSPDGLRWTPSPRNPVGAFFEMAGITKFNGLYYVCGQDGLTARQPFRARSLATFASEDFETWSPVAAEGLRRHDDQVGPSNEAEWNQREEIHLGATLWNRGNVLLGVYGQWHGHFTGDRRFVSIDLGLTLSHDGLHHEEPVPDFRLVPAREQPQSDPDWPALQQGQGFENVGDRTLFWYSSWRANDRVGVRLVSWGRDRLGYLQPFRAQGAQVVSTRIDPKGGAAPALRLNVSGLGPHAQLRVSLLDAGFRPVPGFSGADAAVVQDNGFAVPVGWAGATSLPADKGALRIQCEFIGVRPEDIRLHAAYLTL
jgi:hypothetical protein